LRVLAIDGYEINGPIEVTSFGDGYGRRPG
jgi:hypothetical protein